MADREGTERGAGMPVAARHGADEPFRRLVADVVDYALFLLDAEGRVASWNAGAERIHGYAEDEILGEPLARFYPAEARESGRPAADLAAARAEGHFEEEGWRVRQDGTPFWADVVLTALSSSNGAPRGFLGITRDLTVRRREEEALRQSEERFRLLVEGVQDYAIYMLDPEGRVVSWNAGAERIKGYPAQEIIGESFGRFFLAEDAARGRPERALEVARRYGRFEDEGWRVRKDGTRFWASAVITALRDRTGQLRGYAKITRDLTERKRIEALEAAERRMQEFLAVLGHELRNPLAPIRNAVAVLQKSHLEDSGARWSRDVIDRQVAHLSRLVDDLLDVSRISSGKITLQREPVDLSAVIARALEASRPLIEDRGQALEVAVPLEPVQVEGDLTRLSQVVLNLLNNAAKYTPEGGQIHVSAAREGRQAVIRVRDTGIGIAPELLTHIFEPFTQGERSLDRAQGGLGLGLALVRRLVEMHGGSVAAWSEGQNRGTEFVIRLPLLAATPSAPRPGAREEETAPGSTAAMRVLVVDDNADACESMALLLRMWGHEVRTAQDGPAALAAFAEQPWDVVLLDIGLPGMDGYEVAGRMRDLPGGERTTLIALTGYGQHGDRRRARDAGFDHHLVKPVEPDSLKKLLYSLRRSPPNSI